MKITIAVGVCVLTILLAAFAQGAAPAKKGGGGKDPMPMENQAVIVVTGLRLNEDPEKHRIDLSAGEGAVVKLVSKDGAPQEKKTQPFARVSRHGEGPHFTADFVVDLDTVYTITMTFKDGTTVRIDDYRLPAPWRTHFFFHSTTGTLSPASILRVGKAEGSDLRCHVYAVYPLENYRKLGGKQVP